MAKYLVVYEWAGTNWSAYAPGVPGCVAVGDTKEEIVREMRDALRAHFEELRAIGEPIPEPSDILAGMVDVPMPAATGSGER